MDEDLLVLLEPGIERRPLETDGVVEALHLGRREDLGGMGPVEVVQLEAEVPHVAPRGLFGRALVDEHAAPDVGEGDVVLRESGPLPDVARLGRVDDRPTAAGMP